MDSIARSAIMMFIKDFDLKKPDGVVSFDASVDFNLSGSKKTLETEVLVITSGNIEAVYLIHPGITGAGLPDMFSSGKEVFTYSTGQCLKIENQKGAEGFEVSIFPKQKH
jgi:hypothetical protein